MARAGDGISESLDGRSRSHSTRHRPAPAANDTFGQWQPRYAAAGLATFPVRIDADNNKVPMVTGYLRTELRRSTEFARKFADATALGIVLGRDHLMLADVDTRDERALADVLAAHGDSPIITLTASKGGFHAWY